MTKQELDQKNHDRHNKLLKKIQSSPKSFIGEVVELELIDDIEYGFTTSVIVMIMAIEVKMYHVRIMIHPVKLENNDEEFSIVHLHGSPQCYLWNKAENEHKDVLIYY
jgi:hypothetical protein